MADRPVLLPQPRELSWGDGALALGEVGGWRVSAAALPRLGAALEGLRAEAPAAGVDVRIDAAEDAPDVLTLAAGRPPPRPADPPDSPEGYVLEVSGEGLRLSAREDHGLHNGIQTLRQILAQAGPRVPAVAIRDWPSLALRGIHLDLKGAMAPAAYWREAIATLAHYKLNAVLVEYEDKFPYASHPEVMGPGALSPDELGELLRTARDHFVQVIPLLQTIGHVEYILRRPEHAHLRESGSLTQFCPREPGGQEVVLELLDELLAAHPEAEYVHLGADEAWLLGDCPRCRAVAEREGKLKLYLDFIGPAIERVLAAGRRPVIWDDMIQRNLQGASLDLLPEGVVLCNWAYGPREPLSPLFFYGGPEGHSRFRWASRQWLDRDPGVLDPLVQWLEEAPEDVVAFGRRYWDRGEYPLRGASLPWIRFFREHGREVIGASAAKGANGFSAFSPLFDTRLENVAVWAEAAREDGATGVISTAWSRYNGMTVPCEPFELGWHAYLASAAFYWEARTPERAALDRQFRATYLGGADEAVTRAIEWLDRGVRTGNPYLLREAARRFDAANVATPVGRRFVRHLALAARLALAQLDVNRLLEGAFAEFARGRGGMMTAERRDRWLADARRLRAALQAWREEAAAVLREGLLDADAREVIETQVSGYEEQLRLLTDELEGAVPLGG